MKKSFKLNRSKVIYEKVVFLIIMSLQPGTHINFRGVNDLMCMKITEKSVSLTAIINQLRL